MAQTTDEIDACWKFYNFQKLRYYLLCPKAVFSWHGNCMHTIINIFIRFNNSIINFKYTFKFQILTFKDSNSLELIFFGVPLSLFVSPPIAILLRNLHIYHKNKLRANVGLLAWIYGYAIKKREGTHFNFNNGLFFTEKLFAPWMCHLQLLTHFFHNILPSRLYFYLPEILIQISKQ